MIINFSNKLFSRLTIFLPIIMFAGSALPDILVSICAILLILNIYINKEIEILNNKIFIIFILFWLAAVISSLFSNYFLLSLSSSLFYLRFIFFLFFIKYIASKDTFVQKYFLTVLLFAITFTSIDAIYQSYFQVDLLGNQFAEKDQYRLDGPFGNHEWIVGSYISNYFLIVLAYFYSLKTNFVKSKYLLIIFLFITFYYATFISGERVAFIMMNFIILLFIILNTNFIKNILILFLISIPIFFIAYKVNNSIFDRLLSTFDVLGVNDNEKNFWDSHYGAHYLTSFEIFKNHPIIGSGPKTFRVECAKDEYAKINSDLRELRCSTHPHNIYFQLLSEVGAVGISLFIIFVFYILKNFYNYYNKNDYLFISIYLSIIVFLWPIKSTGSIFNNRYSLFLYYLIMLIIILIEKKK